MSEPQDSINGKDGITRRSALAAIGIGAATAVGLGGITGSALAWDRRDVEFKGCSEVWAIVGPDDLEYGNGDDSLAPYPAVAHVIVATDEGDLACRVLEFTPETATRVPGHYGDAPVVKYAAAPGEKVLGLIMYNYSSGENRFSRESPLFVNDHRCSNTPGTPDPRDAPCADNTYTVDRADGSESPGRPGTPGNDGQSGKEEDSGNAGGSNDDDQLGGRGPPENDEESADGDHPGKGRGPPENPGRSNGNERSGNGRGSGRGR